MTRCRGATLAELLVSMLLLSMLTAGGLAAHAHLHAAHESAGTRQRLHERAQYVLSTLERDLQMAGYFGGSAMPAALPASGIPLSARSCGGDLIARIDRGVEITTSLPRDCPARGGLATGSSILVVRRASAQVSAPHPGRAQWLAGDRFQDGGKLIWDGVPGASGPGNSLRDLIVRMYYVARSADADAATPALRVKSLTEAAGSPAFVDTEVMPGVERLSAELLPPQAPKSVRIAVWIRGDAADVRPGDPAQVLQVTRHVAFRNALSPR